MEKRVLGLVAKVKIRNYEILARVDTGARRCSMEKELAERLKLGPVIGNRKYKSASGRSIRPVIEEEIEIKGIKKRVKINLTNRKHMRYNFLIGREALKKNFIIDPDI